MRKWVVMTALGFALGGSGTVLRAQAQRPTEMVSTATPGTAAPGPRIAIAQFKFGESSLTVPAGTTVTWTNRDQDSHTVTSTDGAFASPALDFGEAFSYRFAKPGTYTYYCALHPHMTARIIVK